MKCTSRCRLWSHVTLAHNHCHLISDQRYAYKGLVSGIRQDFENVFHGRATSVAQHLFTAQALD